MGAGISANQAGSTSTASCTGRRWRTATGGGCITAPFLHYGPLHLGMNMLVLWFIGPTARGVLRARALRARLSRLRARRIGRSAHLFAQRTDGRRVGRDLGDHGGRSRPRGEADLRLRRAGDGARRHQRALTFLIPGISIGGHVGGFGGARCARSPSRASGARRRSRPSRSQRSAWSASASRSHRWVEPQPQPPTRDSCNARFCERRLRGSEPRERDAIGRARDVVEPEPVTEGDRVRLAAVLTADPEFDRRLRTPPALDGDPHELADALLVDHLERVPLEDPMLEVVRRGTSPRRRPARSPASSA